MGVIAFLIFFPFLAAVVLSLMKKQSKARDGVVYTSCILIVAAVIYLAVTFLSTGQTQEYLVETAVWDHLILAGEIFLMLLVFYYGFRYKKYYVVLLSAAGTLPIVWEELAGYGIEGRNHITVDYLTIIMCLIVGVVGSLICLYAVSYMKDYHKHHTDCRDRTSFFLAMLFVFLGAMFGLVFSANLSWMFFFWEITSICSFLLIGYSQNEIAIRNSFRALWMNLLGGFGFSLAILYCTLVLKIANIQDLVKVATRNGSGDFVAIPLACLAFAALTKSAQMPFSRWLLGAMVAPTPTSALLHSATMVKAGVYLLIRLSPAMQNTLPGMMVILIGGFTFFAASVLAISQSDGKKVLAYSTISNLGLITACAGVGTSEATWAAILLMIFHAVAKSLMFLSTGAVENCTGSRDIEDMHGLIVRLPKLAFVMMIGIFGMFLAPFGMLISKWAALKSFVDSGNVLLMLFVAFGSGTTMFYWTKWLGKLIAVPHSSRPHPDTVHKDERVALGTLAALVVILCILFPLISSNLVRPVLVAMFHTNELSIITRGDIPIMLLMMCMIVIIPLVARLLTAGKTNKPSLAYMAGINKGDDVTFVDSFGESKQMYLANWYFPELFGENKLLKPCLAVASAILVILMVVSIGGVL
ncbi:NADH-quinone oxidoreductase subunit L [Thermocaproicibacter melissae]|jgi:ech hydrogenase subunit A|uniref:NADH-quinone oxidoreductase subunit 5 family protein n=1 Tax=Thermocaproicibacter melissae TaxID=2966552 RepID=UPI0024B062DE|nr:proton-conducting transporter membrane subunit [Thermocaproicibacter melissae]WBY63505.1 proton-conducting transporter membrane subunit [Thermocaproicibacter melissae]